MDVRNNFKKALKFVESRKPYPTLFQGKKS
jgi:hypothetical protein